MANNKIEAQVIVDDKGSLKQTATKAQKAAKGLDEVGAKAGTADRNLKGAAQASSNGTKNFSKMAQGMSGGLVPAYAAVAAQVFALTAAFDFLKRAADVQNLIAGQTQFANSTGVALKSVSSKLQEASQGMLSFQEAAQSAAIGAAKGFTVSQLEDLAVGAGKAATALGRDYTDTYDRLIRGVSKAEPELLDELGITLKLAEAKRKYAEMIGVSADQLTAAQSSQAVLVETMSQLNNQFGEMENRPNPFIQLQKTFSGIATEVLSNIMPAFTAIANFLNNNAKAAAIAFAGIVGMVLLNISGLSEGLGKVGGKIASVFSKGSGVISSFASKGFDSATSAANDFIDKMEDVESSIKDAYSKQKEITSSKASALVSKGSTSKSLQKVASGADLTPQAVGKLKKDIDNAIEKMGDLDSVASGVFEGLTKDELKGFRKELDKTGKSGLSIGQKIKKGLAKTGVKALKGLRKAAKITTMAVRGIGKAASFAAKGMKMLGKATVILAVIQQLYDLFMQLAKAPYTLLENFVGVLANIGKGIQFVLNNVVVRGINALGDALPEWAKKMLGIETGGKLMTEFTFADNATKDLMNLADKGLKLVGVEGGTKALKDQEAKSVEAARQKEARESALEDLRNLATEMKTIEEGILAKTGTDRTKNIANAFATLPLLGALKAAKKENLIEEFDAAIDAAGISLDAFGPSFKKAFQEKDEQTIQKLVTAGLTYNASLSSVTDTLANLSDLMTNDPLQSKILLEGLRDTAITGDSAAVALGQVGNAVNLVNEQFSNIGGIDNYLRILNGVIEGQARFKTEKQAIGLAGIKSNIAPTMFKNADKRELDVRTSKNKLLDISNEKTRLALTLSQETDETKRAQLGFEIAALQEAEALETARLDNATRNLSDVGRIGMAIGESLSSSMHSAFQGLVDGSMKAKDAFANMAKSVLQSISKIITELLVVKLLKSTLGGTGFGDFLGITSSNRYGGVVNSSGKLPGYAVGGVARGPQSGYPVELHGTEAIVPLPNGKSIPVEMKQGGGTNNVVVNVSVDNQGNSQTTTEGQTSEDAGRLGQMIASAVQQELHNQKRSGGILNPYGVA